MPSSRHCKASAPCRTGPAPSSCHTGRTSHTAALLPRQLLVVLLLLACSTRAAYGCKFFSRSSATAASHAAPVRPPHPDLPPSVPDTPIRPIPDAPVRPEPDTPSKPATPHPSDPPAQQAGAHQSTQATWRRLVKEAKRQAKEEVKDQIDEALEEQYAGVTCQPWCQNYCLSISKQGPACINAAGELSSTGYFNTETATEDTMRVCDEFCQSTTLQNLTLYPGGPSLSDYANNTRGD